MKAKYNAKTSKRERGRNKQTETSIKVLKKFQKEMDGFAQIKI